VIQITNWLFSSISETGLSWLTCRSGEGVDVGACDLPSARRFTQTMLLQHQELAADRLVGQAKIASNFFSLKV